MPTFDRYQFALGTLGSEVMVSANDCDLNVNLEDLAKDIRLASGVLKRYKIFKPKHWLFNYSWIWHNQRNQFDNGMGFAELYALYSADNEMSFLEATPNATQTAYTVRFGLNSFHYHLKFRSGDMSAYGLQFELVQVS
jgi:hypothetical protein